jgi:exopolyphosphatase/guanosine-5'-triphosphate,3'-diphosphate pyrophosphatase
MQINVLDLGSNSFHLLEAWVGAGHHVRSLGARKHSLRLGDKAFRRGEIDAGDWQRALSALADLLVTARKSTPAALVAVATSVFRDTRNGREFLADVQQKLGLTVELLSEGSEAELSLRGALSQLVAHGYDSDEQTLVVDIGGGSLELAFGHPTRCSARRSLPLGVLRLSHACLGEGRVLRRDHIGQVESLVHGALREGTRPRASQVVLASGTARRVAKLAAAEQLAPGVYRLPRAAIARLVHELVDKTPAQLIARGVPSARTDTLGVGAIALGAVLDLWSCESALVTSTGLREGVAAYTAERLSQRLSQRASSAA